MGPTYLVRQTARLRRGHWGCPISPWRVEHVAPVYLTTVRAEAKLS